ncbi:MAG: histidine kinase [Bacteroidota bacterium]
MWHQFAAEKELILNRQFKLPNDEGPFEGLALQQIDATNDVLFIARIYPLRTGYVILRRNRKVMIEINDAGSREYRLGKQFSPGTLIHEYRVDQRGQGWLATNCGLYPVSMVDDEIIPVGNPILADEEVISLHIDRNDNFWIGTSRKGLFLLNTAQIRQFPFPAGTTHFLEYLHRHPDGFVKGISHSGECMTLTPEGIKSQKLLSPGGYKGFFAVSSQAGMVYGTPVLWEIDHKGNRQAYVGLEKNGKTPIPVANVKTIARVDQDIWVGNHGVTYKLDQVSKTAEIVTKGRTLEILEDTASGKVWLGNRRGLLVYTPEQGAQLYRDKSGGTFAYMVYALAQGSDGSIYVGTHGKGLWKIKGDSLERIDQKLSIQAHQYKEIIRDGAYLWCSTNTGLFKIDPTLERAYKVSLGGTMPTEELFGLAVDDSLLWVATSTGVTYFPKDIAIISEEAPPIFLETFRAMNKKGERVFGRELPVGFDQIEIEFSSISYSEKISYEFRVGQDGFWQPLAAPFLRLSSIAPGSHLYQVRAVRGNGVTSTSPLDIRFELRPPFWQNVWFLIPALGLLAFLVFLMIRSYFLNRLRRTELQAAMQNEVERSRLAALRAQMNPHFTFNVLNAIQQFLLMGNARDAHVYLADFAKLIRASLDRSHDDLIPLFKEIAFLKTYVRLESLRFEERITVVWDIDPKLEHSIAHIPNMIIQPLIENAILHGLGNVREEGTLLIKVHLEGEEGVRFFVMDNGIGIMQAQLSGQGEHESKGTHLLAQRLEWIYQSREHKADIQWLDLGKHPHAYPFLPAYETGTLVTVFFPNI